MTNLRILAILGASVMAMTGGARAQAPSAHSSHLPPAVEYFRCKLAGGATMDQLVAAAGPMLKEAREAGVGDYKLHFLVPLYSDDISKGSFVWVGESPNATRLGAFNDFYLAEGNKSGRDRMYELTGSCTKGGLDFKFETSPSK